MIEAGTSRPAPLDVVVVHSFTERRREHLAELNTRATETDQRLNRRLYDAIESGVADLNDDALKERIAALKPIRDQAKTDADRAQTALLAESLEQRLDGRLAIVETERM